MDLVFVTGDEKADWFVRSGNTAIYPRPELVDEYRRASGGKKIRLSSLADLLGELDVKEEVVKEIRDAEVKANTAAQTTMTSSGTTYLIDPSFLATTSAIDPSSVHSFTYTPINTGGIGSTYISPEVFAARAYSSGIEGFSHARRVLCLPFLASTQEHEAFEALSRATPYVLHRLHSFMPGFYVEYPILASSEMDARALQVARTLDQGARWLSPREITTYFNNNIR